MGSFEVLKDCLYLQANTEIISIIIENSTGFADVVELVDTLDLGVRQEKVHKNIKMRMWWNW